MNEQFLSIPREMITLIAIYLNITQNYKKGLSKVVKQGKQQMKLSIHIY